MAQIAPIIGEHSSTLGRYLCIVIQEDTMNDLSVFENAEFGKVRVITRDGEPWFVVADVCRTLEIGNSRMATDRLDEDEKAAVSLTDTSSNGVSQNRKMSIVNEPGLYSLVLGSCKRGFSQVLSVQGEKSAGIALRVR